MRAQARAKRAHVAREAGVSFNDAQMIAVIFRHNGVSWSQAVAKNVGIEPLLASCLHAHSWTWSFSGGPIFERTARNLRQTGRRKTPYNKVFGIAAYMMIIICWTFCSSMARMYTAKLLFSWICVSFLRCLCCCLNCLSCSAQSSWWEMDEWQICRTSTRRGALQCYSTTTRWVIPIRVNWR